MNKKIITYEFTIPQVALIDGELQEIDPINKKATFTLLLGGIGVFEENYGKSLMGTLSKFTKANSDEMINDLIANTRFIQELASASYVKVENGSFENNRATAQEFKTLDVYKQITDTKFILELITMASACLLGDSKPQEATNKSKRKNK